MSRVGMVVAATATVLAAAVGCTTESAGSPAPAGGGGESSATMPPSSEEPDRHGAPNVTDPLDADRFTADPCAALTEGQLVGFGITSPGEPNTEGAIAERAGPSCTWQTDQDPPGTLGVGFLTGNENGLADVYANREQYPYFEETTVNGYPAVFGAILGDYRDEGECTILVGVSDSLYFRVTEQGELDAVGACERVEQVAAAVIGTIQGG